MGRVGVDIYPEQVGVRLEDVDVVRQVPRRQPDQRRRRRRPARPPHRRHHAHGRRPVRPVRPQALRGFGVDDRFVTPVAGLPTPVTFCEIFPPDDFPLYFYRLPKAPDLEIHADELDLDAIRAADIFWVTGTGLSQEPSRAAHAGRARGARRARHHGPRPRLPADVLGVARGGDTRQIQRRPPVRHGRGRQPRGVRGRDRRDATRSAAAEALLAAGVELAVVKQGPAGVLGVRGDESVVVPPVPVDVVNGLGAGDAFGGALCHGLLAGWDAGAHAARSPTPPVRSSPPGSPAPTPCPPPPRSPRCSNGGRSDDHRDTPRASRASSRRACATRAGSPSSPQRRQQPAGLVGDTGRLLLVAADHPARGALRAGDDALAMGDRAELLGRLVRALERPGVDGVLGTADILEDLLLLGALDGKVVIGSMNRGGLAGTVFEIDDRFTGYDAAAIAARWLPGRQDAAAHRPRGPRDRPRRCRPAPTRSTSWPRTRSMAMVEPFISRRASTGGSATT